MAKAKTDAELLREISQGNENSFNEFYNKYISQVIGVVKNLRSFEPEDDVQKTFLKVHEKASCFDGRKNAGPWLNFIARNTVFDSKRKDKTKNKATVSYDEIEYLDNFKTTEQNPREILYEQEFLEGFEKILNQFPKDSQYFFQSFLGGLRDKQIAYEKLDSKAIKQRRYRMRQKIKQDIEKLL